MFLFSDKYSEAEYLDHMVILFLIFWGTSILFSIIAYQFTFPPTVYKCSLFSTSSTEFVISCLFLNNHSSRCEVISGFDLHFPNDQWCGALLHVPVGDQVCLLWENICSDTLPICWLDFLLLSCMSFFYVFWILIPY